MSTFTDWNGPQNSNIRASDLVQFANSYSDLVARLNQHLQETVASDNVHAARDYVDHVLAEYAKLADLQNKLTAYYTSAETDNKYATKEMLPDLTPYAKVAQIPDITPLANKREVEIALAELNTALSARITAIDTLLTGLSKSVEGFDVVGVLEASEALRSKLIETTRIQLLPKRYSAYVGGSDYTGVFYILGMLTDKAGTAYVKYQDDNFMAAVVQFAEQDTGALTVTCANNKLTDLKFFIVTNTDSSGNVHKYLAVQAKEWLPTFTSTDGVGYHQTLEFDSAGINFAPVGTEAFIKPNGAATVVCECASDTGFSSSAVTTSKFIGPDGESIFNVVINPDGTKELDIGEKDTQIVYKERPILIKDDLESPFVTVEDLEAITSKIGEITYWPKFELVEDKAVPIDYPDDYLPCDGKWFDSKEYPELYKKLGSDRVPVVDYCIIRAKYGLKVTSAPVDTGEKLDDVVATLHGINVVNGMSNLPGDAEIGVPYIVRTYKGYYVYVKNDVGDWVRYTTLPLTSTIKQIQEALGTLDQDITAVRTDSEWRDLGLQEQIDDNKEAINENKESADKAETRLDSRISQNVAMLNGVDRRTNERITHAEQMSAKADAYLNAKIDQNYAKTRAAIDTANEDVAKVDAKTNGVIGIVHEEHAEVYSQTFDKPEDLPADAPTGSLALVYDSNLKNYVIYIKDATEGWKVKE